ncbi:MAG: AAA family ATPase [Deltaproteobacteria bacterium]|nr:AAA family ATPase [Deltaproteobacteria bacterium]
MSASKELADQWLGAELNRIWLLSERALRAFQQAQIRPQPGHPSIAEVEAILAARRASRHGAPQPGVDDEASLTKAIDEVEAKLGALRVKAPLGRLIENLDLRPLEIETLLVVIAPHLDAPLADVFNVLKNAQTGRRGVDLALIAQLFRLRRSDRVSLLDALDPERPLMRWRLIQALPAEAFESFNSMSHRALRPTFDLVSTLCGRTELAPELTRFATLVRGAANLEGLRYEPQQRDALDALCQAAKGGNGGPWMVLWGPSGIGKRTAAERIAAHADRPLLAFDPNAVERSQFDDVFTRVCREALIRSAVLYIGPLTSEHVSPERSVGLLQHGGRELVRRLADYKGPLVLGVDGFQPPKIAADHAMWELRLTLPSEPVRGELWSDALPQACRAPDVQLDNLARAFNLTPGEILRSAQEARLIAQRDRGRLVAQKDIRNGIERRLRNDLGELARRITVTTRWEDLVLPREDLDRVEEFISRKKHQDTVYRTWGFGERVGYGKGLIGLVSGPPGTGKTMLAGLIAQALDLDLYQVDLAQVVSKWVGETEKQLGKVFDQAERAHAVLLFDEADSLFAKRVEVKQANDRFGNMATNYLLQRLEQYTGVAVLTTNKDTALDEALQRRLTLHLRLDIPDVDERRRLWSTFLPPKAPVEPGIDLRELAAEFELSGGYIKNAAVRAAFLAAQVGAPIGMEVLRLASALELEDMGRVVWARAHESGADDAPQVS